MGDGLKKGASATFKKAIEKVTNNPLVSFLTGLLVTAIIQSSTATIVITSGLVGAGILTLSQSIGIILGANVGTTVTGQIIRLMDLDTGGADWLQLFTPSTLAPFAAIVGILLISFIHFKNSDTFGDIAIGFGILFTGLMNMTAAVSVLSESGALSNLFLLFADQPFLAFLIGFAVSFILQSSSASIGILQSISMAGMITFGSVVPIMLGIYIGDAFTTFIVCAIGAKADAKRVGMIQVLFNISKVIVLFVAVTLLHSFGVLDSLWNEAMTPGSIANTGSVFNISCALLLLPLTKVFEQLSRRVIKDDRDADKGPSKDLASLDKALYSSPALALSSSKLVISKMAEMSARSVTASMNNLIDFDKNIATKVKEDEDYLDEMADQTGVYLVNLLPHIEGSDDNEELNYYLTCLSEFERMSDLALNLIENSERLRSDGQSFSATAKDELRIIGDALEEIITYSVEAFTGRDISAARHIEPIEEVVDDLVADMRESHLVRLKAGKCGIDSGFSFLDALVNIERIADQCSNIGVHTMSLFRDSDDTTPHDYIKELHQGKDAAYNSEYRQARDHYLGRLSKAIEKDEVTR